MKRLSFVILVFSFTAYAFSISRAGMFEVEQAGMISDSSLDLTIDYYAAIKPIPNPGALQVQDWQYFDAHDAFSLDRNTGGLPLPHISDSFGRGGGALFITGAIAGGHNSVLDSSTMLMLGTALVGLSGYFGRRKFKR
jgi:LPXTG-motif cell wall-anchored protein